MRPLVKTKTLQRATFGWALVLLGVANAAAGTPPDSPKTSFVVVIDAGHGGKDSGA